MNFAWILAAFTTPEGVCHVGETQFVDGVMYACAEAIQFTHSVAATALPCVPSMTWLVAAFTAGFASCAVFTSWQLGRPANLQGKDTK